MPPRACLLLASAIVLAGLGVAVRRNTPDSTPRVANPAGLDSHAAATRNDRPKVVAGGIPNTADALLNELNLGSDSALHEEFRLGPGGDLIGTPTRRLAMLNEQGRRDPVAAATYARTVLEAMQSADEWALCLRLVARADDSPETRAYLKGKLRAMWAHAPWRDSPSIGYLEAFDVAVHLGGTELLPELTGMIRDQNSRATGHAAFLAVDRLVIHNPASTLERLEADPALMAGRETTRANYFGRADVARPDQAAVLERYLLGSARSPAELQSFAEIFPNVNYMVSHDLLTSTDTPDGAAIRVRDRAALAWVEASLGDPRFGRLRPYLLAIRSRVGEFVR
jgi:hypothetical protein